MQSYPLQQVVPTVTVDPATGIVIPGSGAIPNPLPIDGGNPSPVKIIEDPAACFPVKNCPGTCLETELCLTTLIPPAVAPTLTGAFIRGAPIAAGDTIITVPAGVIWELRGLALSTLSPVGSTTFGSLEVFATISGVEMVLGSIFFTGFTLAINAATSAALTATLKDLTLGPGDKITLRTTLLGGAGATLAYAGVAFSSFTAVTPYAEYYSKARR